MTSIFLEVILSSEKTALMILQLSLRCLSSLLFFSFHSCSEMLLMTLFL